MEECKSQTGELDVSSPFSFDALMDGMDSSTGTVGFLGSR